MGFNSLLFAVAASMNRVTHFFVRETPNWCIASPANDHRKTASTSYVDVSCQRINLSCRPLVNGNHALPPSLPVCLPSPDPTINRENDY